MLVLSRRCLQSIVVGMPDGRRIVFEVVEIRGDKVRLGVTAPEDIPVHRKEVQEQVDNQCPQIQRSLPQSDELERR